MVSQPCDGALHRVAAAGDGVRGFRMPLWRTEVRRLIAMSLGLLALHACGPAGRSSDQNGVATWTLEPLFALGTGQGLEFQRVPSVLWLPDGHLVVADAGARRLLVFDSLGRHAGTLGREGAGPGEYRTPATLALLGDTIVLQDPGNARLGFFLATGSWAGSRPVPPISGPQIRLYRVPGHEFYAVGVQTGNPTMATLTFVRYDAAGPKDTLLRAQAPPAPDEGAVCRGSDRGIHFFSTPWGARYIEQPGPGRTILRTTTDRYDIVRQNPQGDTVARYRGPAPASPITDAQWDSATSELRDYLARDAAAQCNTRTLQRPARKPAIRAFFWSDDGHLWVERYDASGMVFDVFDEAAHVLATFPAPDHLEEVEPHVLRNRLALVTASPDGTHLVHAFRVVRTP